MNIPEMIDRFVQGLQAQEIEFRQNEDGAPSVIISPDSLGPYENGSVMMEISGISLDEEDGLACIEFLTSVAQNIPMEKFGGLLVKLNDLNKREMPGCYGLLNERGVLFHRYTLLVPETEPQPEGYIFKALRLILERIDEDFTELFLALELA